MRIIQVIDALDYGDGVSNDVLHLKDLLQSIGRENRLYCRWANEKVKAHAENIDQYKPQHDDLIVYHFSGISSLMDRVLSYPGKKIVRYHNITPPEFFWPANLPAYRNCKEGLRQIKENIHHFDGFWADSSFNMENLLSFGADPKQISVLPIIFDFEHLKNSSVNEALLRQLRQCNNIIFVGRVAPNKCIEDVLLAFDNYGRYHDPKARFYIVGNDERDSAYSAKVHRFADTLQCGSRICFTGKVSTEDLCTYYRGAGAFLCMSEHEGFCMPLLEAQYFQIPVIAYSSCAVPSTMGDSGILLYTKNPAVAANLIDTVLNSQSIREAILEKQNMNIQKYSGETVRAKIVALLNKWEDCCNG